MSSKKKVFWTIVTVILAILSIVTVFVQEESLSTLDLEKALRSASPVYLILAVLSMLGFIVFEGEAIRSILKQVGYKRHPVQGFLYAAGDVYFSAVTPSATGGQPASAFFMMGNQIPGPIVTAVLILNLVMYVLAILTIGILSFLTRPDIFLHFHLFSKILIIIGAVMLVILALSFMLLLKNRRIIETLCRFAFRILHRMHLCEHPEREMDKLEKKMDDYQDCVEEMRGHKKALLYAYFWNLLQRISQLLVSAFMFLALGGVAKESFSVWVTQVFVAIGSYSVPIPGGMGVTDYLMLDGFRGLMSDANAAKLEMLSRGMSFYICVIICGITCAIGYVINKRNGRKGK